MNFFIYPTKDTTLYKQKKLRKLNAGADEVIELTNTFDERSGHNVSRILLEFDTTNIKRVADDLASPRYQLNLKLMQSSELTKLDIVSAYPVIKSWEEGTGRFVPASDSKFFSPGANWKYSDGEESQWVTGSTTDSSGGGDWYDSEQCMDTLTDAREIVCEYKFSDSFSDIQLDITTIVEYWINGDIENNGIILKFKDESIENGGNVKFYSRQTNTIYQPYLLVSYLDYFFNPCECKKIKRLVCVDDDTSQPTPTPIESLVSGSLVSGSLVSGSLCSGSLVSGSLVSGSLVSGSIVSGSLVSGSLVSGSLVSGSIVSGSLVSGSLVSGSIVSGSLVSGSLVSGSLVSGSLVSGSLVPTYHNPTLPIPTNDTSHAVMTDCSKSSRPTVDDGSAGFTLSDDKVCGELKQVVGDDIVPHIKRIRKQYRTQTRERISVGVREKYPTKTFSSKSAYDLNNFVLDSMKYSVRDAETEEIVIPFDKYSRVCCDSSGHYFNFDFSCLQIGRLYKFLILHETEYGDTVHEDARTFIIRS